MNHHQPASQDPPQPTGVFVYGTLQRGQQRQSAWPRRPVRILPAVTQGRLFDLGPYPALLPGDGLVAGELWCFRAADLEATLEVLDVIEGHTGAEDDLYRRRLVECCTGDGQRHWAYAYFFNRSRRLIAARPLAPGPDGVARWPEKGR
ncbi:MAG: gamma-glutamylcyclotransferase [Pirellulales bacterium]|nr:gamma-glutamylcyclotransferase [Pirellulales bacterium]